MRLNKTLGPREWDEFLRVCEDAGIIESGKKNGTVVSFVEVADDGQLEARAFSFMHASEHAHELNARLRAQQIAAVKKMNKPELLEYAEARDIEVPKRGNKDIIKRIIIDWIKEN